MTVILIFVSYYTYDMYVGSYNFISSSTATLFIFPERLHELNPSLICFRQDRNPSRLYALEMATKSHIFSSELLSRVAQKASMLMLGLAKETPPSCEGANIATQLHLIKGALESQPVPPEEVQALCYLVLQDLFSICTVCFSNSGSLKGVQHIRSLRLNIHSNFVRCYFYTQF